MGRYSDMMCKLVTWCLTKGGDTRISFPPPPFLPDNHADPFLCNSPKQIPLTSIWCSQIISQNVFQVFEPSNNTQSLLLFEPSLRGAVGMNTLCGERFLPAVWVGERRWQLGQRGTPRGPGAGRESRRLPQEAGGSWTHSRERLKGSGVLSAGTWSGTKKSLFISFRCTGWLYIPYEQLKKAMSSPFNQLWKRWKVSEEKLSLRRMAYSHYRIIFKEKNCTRLIF